MQNRFIEQTKESTIFSEQDAEETIPITIYYPDEQFNEFLTYEKELKPDPLIVLQEVFNSDKTTFNEGTKLLGVEVKDRIAYVNLNERFHKTKEGAFLGDTLFIISTNTIIKTLTLNKPLNIDSVEFLIEGVKPDRLHDLE